MRLRLGTVTVFCFFLCSSLTLFDQRNTAAISGRTTDGSDAVIPGAPVNAVQISTGTTSRTRSNESGFYQLPNPSPGT